MGQDFQAFSGVDGQPSEAERLFLKLAAESEPVDLSELADDAEARRLSPALVRAAVAGTFRHSDWPDWAVSPSGLIVVGAYFETELDFALLQIPYGVGFVQCKFAAGVDFGLSEIAGDVLLNSCEVQGAVGLLRLRAKGAVTLEGSSISVEGGAGVAVFADQLEADGISLQNCVVVGRVSLSAARLRLGLSLARTRIHSIENAAITARALTTLNADCTSVYCSGAVDFQGSEFTRGLVLVGARINSRTVQSYALNLTDCRMEQLSLTSARIGGGMTMARIRVSGPVLLDRCTIVANRRKALKGDQMQAGMLQLNDSRIRGAVELVRADVQHDLDAQRLVVRNAGAAALSLHHAKMGEFRFDEARIQGSVHMPMLHATGQVSGDGVIAEKSFDEGFEFYCQGLQAVGFRMNRCRIDGCLDVNAAVIENQFSLLEADIGAFRMPRALRAQDLVADSMWLNNTVLRGQLDLNGARLTGALFASGIRILADNVCAISAFDAQFGQLDFGEARVRGWLDLSRTEDAGPLRLNRARLLYPGAYAVVAQQAEFRRGIDLESARIAGSISFVGATVEKGVNAAGIRVRCAREAAILFDDADVTGAARFAHARLSAPLVAARATFRGLLDLEYAQLSAGPVPDRMHEVRPRDPLLDALNLVEARIEGRLVLPRELPRGVVNLARARCDTLEDFRSGWPAPLPKGADMCDTRRCVEGPEGRRIEVQHLVLDGFEYSHLEHPAGLPGAEGNVAEARQAWLAGQSAADLKTHFNPQPWRQASVVAKGMGYDEAAQAIAIERRVRQRMADGVRPFERVISALLHWVADYGFNPWKAVGISAAIVLGFALIFGAANHRCPVGELGLCGGQSAFVQPRAADFEQSVLESGGYPSFRPVAFAFDLFVPFIDFGVEPYWRSNDAARIPLSARPASGAVDDVENAVLLPGGLLTLLSILLQLLGATLIAIIITGFTGLLVREDR